LTASAFFGFFFPPYYISSSSKASLSLLYTICPFLISLEGAAAFRSSNSLLSAAFYMASFSS